MFKELKKKSFKRSLVLTVMLLLAGAAIVVAQADNAVSAFTGYEDFTTLKPDEIKNQLVDVELVENFGCYLEEYEENTSTHATKTTDYYYVIYTGASDDLTTDYKFMTIKVPASVGRTMDKMTQNTYDGVESYPVSFSGKIKKLSKEEYSYFVAFWEDMGLSAAEIEEMTLPYYINTYDKGVEEVGYFVCFFLGISLLIWGIVRIIKGASGAYLKKLRRDIKAAGYTEDNAESDFNTAVSYTRKGTVKIGRLFTFYYFINGSIPRVIPNNRIIWAYQHTTTHSFNGFKTGTTYGVMYWIDGYKRSILVSVPDEASAQEILQKINQMFPWVVVGYSDELMKMYNKDRAQFMTLRFNTVEHVPVEPGFEGFNGQFNTPQGM